MAGHADIEVCGVRADAGRVAHGRIDHLPGLGRRRGVALPVCRFAGLVRIGIDEISYKRGHRYLTVVVDHDTGRLVWAAPGRDGATLRGFFDALEASGPGRCAQITHVSADGADWIGDVVAERRPNAIRCAAPFHVVSWATDALDEVRRGAWNDTRRQARSEPKRGVGRPRKVAPARPASDQERGLKGARYAR